MTDGKTAARVRLLAAVVAFLFAAIVTRLWFLQVLASEDYRERAETNRVRLVPQPPIRGRILDRNGKVLVANRSSLQITVNPRAVPDPDALLFRLSEVLGTPVAELAARLDDPTYLSYQPIPVAEDVPERVAAYIEEHSREFPGVSYRVVGVRDRPYGDLAAHLLGYLGEVNDKELGDPAFAEYRPGDEIGREGVERYYEQVLRGEPGLLSLQIDAQGRVGSVLGRSEPQPGDDLVLSLDLGLQRLAQESLRQGIDAARGIYDDETAKYHLAPAGAVVALDPKTGHVLAMASFPARDPAIFEEGLTQERFERLLAPGSNYPLINRALQAGYPAGSTLKPFVAAAALKSGIADPDGFYPCPPQFEVPGDTSGTIFRNWEPVHRGTISVSEAIARSCDTVFYQFGYQFYRARESRGELMQRQLAKWGFGSVTGVDVPAETAGRIPDARWKQTMHEQAPKDFPEPLWYPGDNVNMSIGQGDLLVTPLQMAAAYVALANGGTLYRPEVGLRVQEPDGTVVRVIEPRVIRRISMPARARAEILEGLVGATRYGTAASAFAGWPHGEIPVAGKTGTAEQAGRQDHSWFAAFAPADDPEIVVVALVEEGGHGSVVAAPIVRRILEGYFGLAPTGFHIGVATD